MESAVCRKRTIYPQNPSSHPLKIASLPGLASMRVSRVFRTWVSPVACSLKSCSSIARTAPENLSLNACLFRRCSRPGVLKTRAIASCGYGKNVLNVSSASRSFFLASLPMPSMKKAWAVFPSAQVLRASRFPCLALSLPWQGHGGCHAWKMRRSFPLRAGYRAFWKKSFVCPKGDILCNVSLSFPVSLPLSECCLPQKIEANRKELTPLSEWKHTLLHGHGWHFDTWKHRENKKIDQCNQCLCARLRRTEYVWRSNQELHNSMAALKRRRLGKEFFVRITPAAGNSHAPRRLNDPVAPRESRYDQKPASCQRWEEYRSSHLKSLTQDEHFPRYSICYPVQSAWCLAALLRPDWQRSWLCHHHESFFDPSGCSLSWPCAKSHQHVTLGRAEELFWEIQIHAEIFVNSEKIPWEHPEYAESTNRYMLAEKI